MTASRMRQWLSRLLNFAGIPGIVWDCDYHGAATSAAVRVRLTDFYTIVSVNGVDVYFTRLTGRIDGTGTTG